MYNLLIIFSILTAYIILFNLGMFIPAKLFGVRVEKFYIWFDPWFKLFSFKTKETEFGLGWFPFGGYIKLSGILVEEHEELHPYYFESLSLFKQLIIIIGGPLSSLILSIGMYSYFYDVEISQFTNVLFQLVAVLVGFFFIFGVISSFAKENENINSFQNTLYYILSLIFYGCTLFLFAQYINEITPFYENLNNLLSGNIKFRDYSENLTNHEIEQFASFLGILFFFWNLIPLAGLSGFNAVNILYRAFTGRKVSEKLVERFTLLSFPFPLLFFGWIMYQLIS